MSKDAIESLLARVKGATGPDRKIDRDLYGLIVGSNPKLRGHVAGVIAGGGHNYPDYTYSLDTIVGLIEAKLPGRWWIVNSGIARTPRLSHAQIEGLAAFETFEAHGDSPPLALLAAFLTALLSEQKP